MKKSNIFIVLAISTILLIPFANVAKAQPSSYVGVSDGEVYTWKVDIDADGLDEVMDNIGTLLDDIQGYISTLDLHGYENLTIPETLDNISSTIANKVLPSGWKALNISEVLEAFISEFILDANSTMFSSKIPGNWESLNVSTFADYVIDGLNTTLPAGWEDAPLPHLIKLALSHFNSTLLFGIIPNGWEGYTIRELINQIIFEQVPKVYESFILHMLLNNILEQTLPSEMELLSIEELLSDIIPSEVSSINVSYIQDMLDSGLPPEIASSNMSELIQEVSLNATANLTSAYVGNNMSTILDGFIDELMYNASSVLNESVLPVGFEHLTIQELADYFITQAITQWDDVVMPGWDTQKLALSLIPSLGLRVEINHIGAEVEAYSSGPRGVPLNMTFFVSLDMKNWTKLSDLFGDTSGGLMTSQTSITTYSNMLLFNLGAYYPSYIVDPTTFSEQHRALLEQTMMTGGLIVASNYNWQTVQTNFSIPVGLNPSGFEGLSEWNSNGVLNLFTLDANGVNAVTISLYSGAQEEIPGYEMAIILVLTPITILGLIYYMKKKNRFQ